MHPRRHILNDGKVILKSYWSIEHIQKRQQTQNKTAHSSHDKEQMDFYSSIVVEFLYESRKQKQKWDPHSLEFGRVSEYAILDIFVAL